MNIIQIVGYKNSGKTTVTSKLVQLLSVQGYRVGTIKNHGHGGQLKKVPGTDSERHLKAGSTISTVLGEDEWLTSFSQIEDKTIDDLIRQYTLYGVDIILIEGLKQEHYPKIVLLRDETEVESLLGLRNIKAIGGWRQPDLKHKLNEQTVLFSNEKLSKKQDELFEVLGIKR